jgi:adenylate cyclase class IV
MLEIEVKSKIDDIASMKEKIAALGGHYTETRHETDHYYNHPSVISGKRERRSESESTMTARW